LKKNSINNIFRFKYFTILFFDAFIILSIKVNRLEKGFDLNFDGSGLGLGHVSYVS
jgi:hypothetical protein